MDKINLAGSSKMHIVGTFGHCPELGPWKNIYNIPRVIQVAVRCLKIHDNLFVVIHFSGTYKQYLVCVRRVVACMAQGGTPYGSH